MNGRSDKLSSRRRRRRRLQIYVYGRTEGLNIFSLRGAQSHTSQLLLPPKKREGGGREEKIAQMHLCQNYSRVVVSRRGRKNVFHTGPPDIFNQVLRFYSGDVKLFFGGLEGPLSCMRCRLEETECRYCFHKKARGRRKVKNNTLRLPPFLIKQARKECRPF